MVVGLKNLREKQDKGEKGLKTPGTIPDPGQLLKRGVLLSSWTCSVPVITYARWMFQSFLTELIDLSSDVYGPVVRAVLLMNLIFNCFFSHWCEKNSACCWEVWKGLIGARQLRQGKSTCLEHGQPEFDFWYICGPP